MAEWATMPVGRTLGALRRRLWLRPGYAHPHSLGRLFCQKMAAASKAEAGSCAVTEAAEY